LQAYLVVLHNDASAGSSNIVIDFSLFTRSFCLLIASSQRRLLCLSETGNK